MYFFPKFLLSQLVYLLSTKKSLKSFFYVENIFGELVAPS